MQTRGRESALALCTLCIRLAATWSRIELFGCAASRGRNMGTIRNKWTGRESRALREAMRLSQRDFANDLGISAKSVGNWESGGAGFVQSLESQAILDTKLRQVSDEVRARFEMILDANYAGECFADENPTGNGLQARSSYDTAGMAAEWPVWFGKRLAHAIGLTDNWREATEHLDSLQEILHREMLMFDAIRPDNAEIRALHAFSRRQALVTLAVLPLTLASSSSISVGTLSPSAATDFFLSRCAASLTACWHLLGGSDLSTIYQTLSSYLLALEGIAQKQSGYQQAAGMLASQAHRICGIVALHHDQLRVREHHCKQALYYATVAANASSQASALISLASTYFYDANPVKAAGIYEQASALESGMSALQRSRVYAELSVVYGQLSREKEAVRAIGVAEELYPDNPEQDPSFLYAEFTPASLSLESGLAYAALAEQYPGRGYQNKAADIFARVDEMTSAPDRIRFEIANHQARTAVLMGDLDKFESHINHGIEGIVLLGSGQRLREARAALTQAVKVWPREARVRAISDGLQFVAGSGIGKGPK